MKIYNKNNFRFGLLLTLLGLGLITASLFQNFSAKGCILSILCLFVGIGMLIRSVSLELSKEDYLNERDERNQLILLKSRSKSFRLTQGVSFVIMILFFLIAKTLNEEIFTALAVGVAFSLTISMITELCAAVYYERRI